MQASHLIHTIDVHVAGWPIRLVNGTIRGDVSDEMSYSEEARKIWEDENSILHWLQREPRGHAAMRVAIVDPSRPNEVRMLVFDSEGPCRGDSLDAACAIVAKAELIAGNDASIRTPGHCYKAITRKLGTSVDEILIEGELSECVSLDEIIHAGGRDFIVDRAICGNEYVIVNAEAAGLTLSVSHRSALERVARQIAMETTIRRQEAGEKPFFEPKDALAGLRIVIADKRVEREGHLRMAVCNENGKLLRAPEGGAIGAILAVMSRRCAEINPSGIIVEGLSGGVLHGAVKGGRVNEGREQLLWELRGRAFVTGSHQFLLDPEDPLPRGFLLR